MHDYKVLVAGLAEEQVDVLAERLERYAFERYELLPQDPAEREALHGSFDAVFCFVPDGRTLHPDMRLFEAVIKDKYSDDPDYYAYTGDSDSLAAMGMRDNVLGEIISILKEVI